MLITRASPSCRTVSDRFAKVTQTFVWVSLTRNFRWPSGQYVRGEPTRTAGRAHVTPSLRKGHVVNVKRIAVTAMAMAGIAWMAAPLASTSASGVDTSIPRYDHIVEIMMENTRYDQLIGNPAAPNINYLAAHYGIATHYYGVTHPSEPNYMANIAGDYFGVQDDDQFYCTPAMNGTDPYCSETTVNHTVAAPTIADQLQAKHLTWKGYFQSLPPAPANLVKVGPTANGVYTFKYPSNSVALYASKHNPFLNFTGTQDQLSNMVDDSQLATDLASRKLPNFSYVVPDQCHDMHGTGGCKDATQLTQLADEYIGNTVKEITSSPVWKHGRNAIVITWDEDDYSDVGAPGTGCCGANPGGGHVLTLVLTNNEDDHIVDNTAYNHYSLLRTLDAAFGLKPLGHAGDSVVPPMTKLFDQ